MRDNNVANRDNVPACVLFPANAADVSTAMKLLSDAPTVPFALKSGGHDWNRGFNSTDGGVLISFRPYLNYTTPSEDVASAEVGPGAKEVEASAVMGKRDRRVVGGRNGHGFTSDNVIRFEVVLANGTIVAANDTIHPDLFWALRGGDELYGSITKFTLQAHPISYVWGGTRNHDSSHTPALLHAVSEFTTNFSDPTAAIIPTVVNGHRRCPDVIGHTGGEPAFRAAAAFNSLPNLDPELMGTFLEDVAMGRVHDAPFSTNNAGDVGLAFVNLAFQPMPVLMQRANRVRGSAALTIDPNAGDNIRVECTAGWNEPRCDFTCMSQLRGGVDTVETAMWDQYASVSATNARQGHGQSSEGFMPIFAGRAMWGQGVYRSYEDESLAKIRVVRQAYDPRGIFLAQTSHFTL